MIEVLNGDVYQWDVGRQVKVDSDVCEVHFASCTSKDAYVTVPVNGVCNIPNILLQSGEDFVIYAMCETESCEQTVTHLRVWVKQRAKPSDYVYTETEVFSYKQLEERIKQLEDNGGSSGGSGVSDVQVNGASIVDKDGNAVIPIMTHEKMGVAKYWNAYGIQVNDEGYLQMLKASNDNIDKRDSNYRAIVPTNLDYAVKQAMCDGKGAEWSATEKANARLRLGEEWRYIGKVETQEDVISMSMSLDETGQPFRLRKVYLKAVNYPNQNDNETWVRFYFNNKRCNVFNDSSFFTGVKRGDIKKLCEVVLEKIENKLIPISIFKSINSTNAANIMSPYLTYGYNSETSTIDDYISEITLAGYQVSIGAGAYFEVWGVDA